MTDVLERIEAKHSKTDEGTCRECPRGTEHPCGFVKLARALDEAATLLRGAGVQQGHLYSAALRMERTLEEVTGA